MPELPEVETVRRGLEPRLVGRRISRVDVRMAKMVRPGVEKFCRNLPGLTIRKLGRKGKLLLWDLDSHLVGVHLKMTGRFDFNPVGTEPLKHSHVIIGFEDTDYELHYNDTRQFGWLHLLRAAELETFPPWAGLGPDALTVSEDRFVELLAGRRGRLKPLMLNQAFVAGMGNIYVDEALFRAGLHPLTPADKLTEADGRRLHRAMHDVLELALRHGGSSISDYRDAEGNLGYFQTRHQVYGKTDQPCPRCGAVIERMILGGRASCYCPCCQAER